LKQCLKRWAEGDFKKDPQLSLIPLLYQKLKSEGVDFTDHETTPKREPQYSKDPNVVSSQQEEDDIARAIELSLRDKTASSPPKSSTSQSSNFQSLYPSMNSSSNQTTNSTAAAVSIPEPRKVRALYDFEAAEDNELTFKAGEVIMVTEESDPNWWRGSNHRGEGFFPANFVTADLSAEPEELHYKELKSIKKEKENEIQHSQVQQAVEINEEAIDRLLFLLHEADPKDPSQDPDEMLRLENMVNQMGPLIDSELERVDRKHAQLTQLSSDLIETINMYHSLMRETDRAPQMNMYSGGYPMYNSPNPYQMNYRMHPSNIPPPGMMPGMPGPQMHNFQMPPTSSAAPSNFQPPSGAFMPPQNPIQNFQSVNMPGGFPQNQMMPPMHPPQQQQQPQQPGLMPNHQIPPQTNVNEINNQQNQTQLQQPTQQQQQIQPPVTMNAPGMQMMPSQQMPLQQPPQQFPNPQQQQQPQQIQAPSI
jgi:signal transducing adaptor molecule